MSIDSNEVPRQLPDNPNLQHLKYQARDLLKAGGAKSLTDAQFKIARLYGFPSWPKLKAHVDALNETGRLKHEIDANDVDLVNIDERTREERYRKIWEYTAMKLLGELSLEALLDAWGATLTQEQEAKLKERASQYAREIKENLRRPGNKTLAESKPELEIKEDEMATLVQISMHQAIQIATTQQPGTVLECRLVGKGEKDRAMVGYQVRILPAEGAERTFTRFTISAIDGRILGREDKR
jgi:uncharacterized membrane protein YkoI